VHLNEQFRVNIFSPMICRILKVKSLQYKVRF